LSDNHIQKIIRAILKQAVQGDFHEIVFQHGGDGLEVNFKKNSEVINKGSIPPVLASSFAAKLKVLAELDPSVSEVPQLGKMSFTVDEITVVASVSTFPTIMGERIFMKVYKPPQSLAEIIKNEHNLSVLRSALAKPGIILVCGSPLSGKTHVIYSLLLEAQGNVMTLESLAKYELVGVNQCELNENVGFNLDKAVRFIEFQSPDVIYIEGLKTKEMFEYFSGLTDKTVIMEFSANNFEDLRRKLTFTPSCLVFVHSGDNIEVFDEQTLQKYLV
jgi:type IV pilus assembly protein PilB